MTGEAPGRCAGRSTTDALLTCDAAAFTDLRRSIRRREATSPAITLVTAYSSGRFDFRAAHQPSLASHQRDELRLAGQRAHSITPKATVSDTCRSPAR
jgi:hypothetical protein